MRSDFDQPHNVQPSRNVPSTGDREAPRYPNRQDSLPRPSYDSTAKLVNSVSNLTLGPEAQLQRGAQRIPAIHNSTTGPSYGTSFTAGSNDHPRRPNAIPDVPSHAQNVNPSLPSFGGPPTNFNQPMPIQFQGQSAFTRQVQPPPHQQMSMQPAMHPTNSFSRGRPPSETSISQAAVRKSSSMRSLASQYSQQERSIPHPPLPGHPAEYRPPMPRTGSVGNLRISTSGRPALPSARLSSRGSSMAEPSFDDPSPPGSPTADFKPDLGPVTSSVSAQMKCKVFLQQHHAQWKSLGSARLILYCQNPTNVKQLVVQSNKSVLISTIVMIDGVERVGKTGIAIELSDKGARTGIIYMLQLQNETLAVQLFDSLLAGSDRSR